MDNEPIKLAEIYDDSVTLISCLAPVLTIRRWSEKLAADRPPLTAQLDG